MNNLAPMKNCPRECKVTYIGCRGISLDPDQSRYFARPDLGIKCLKRLSLDNEIHNSR